MERFGEKLTFLRNQRGLTIRELGDMLDVHNTYITKLEKSERKPNIARVIQIADIFGVTVDVLVRDDVELG